MGNLVDYLKLKTRTQSCFTTFTTTMAIGRLKSDVQLIKEFVDHYHNEILGYYVYSTIWSKQQDVHILLNSGVMITAPNLPGFPDR